MQSFVGTARKALVAGAVASVTSAAALAFVARREGRAAWQPINATSHWLHGQRAAAFTGVDLSRTGTGYATHLAATTFWALFFNRMAKQRPDGAALLVKDAILIAAIAAAVDYGATPKRFTPGWEFVLSRKAMAAAYLAMGAGLAAGVLLDGQARGDAGGSRTPKL